MYPLQERFSDVDAVKATADNVANTQRKMLQKQQFRERAVEQQSSTKIEESNSDDASEEVEPKHRTVVPVIIRAENAASLNVIVELRILL
jgi:translation initiation factor IF-2